jgi:hypothetical protein
MLARTCAAGSTVTTPFWVTTVPAGWGCEKTVPVDPGRGLVLSSSDGAILVEWAPYSDAARECGSRLASSTETVVPMPDTSWGGKRALTVNAKATYIGMQVRCIDGADGAWLLVGIPYVTYEALVSALDSLSASWVWK